MPNSSAAMPKTGGFAPGVHTWVVSRLPELPLNAGSAFQIRKNAMAAMMTSSRPPDPAASPLKTWSPRRTERPVMADRLPGVPHVLGGVDDGDRSERVRLPRVGVDVHRGVGGRTGRLALPGILGIDVVHVFHHQVCPVRAVRAVHFSSTTRCGSAGHCGDVQVPAPPPRVGTDGAGIAAVT